MLGSRARRWQLRRMLFPSSDGYRVRACTHKIAIGDSDLINVRFGPLCGLKSDISRGPRMGWTGRAPAPNGSQSAPGACQERSTTMPRTTTLHAVTAIGIDMGKNTLHLIGLDARGAI